MCLEQPPLPPLCYHQYRTAPQLTVFASLDVCLSVTRQAMKSVHPELSFYPAFRLELPFAHDNQDIATQIMVLADRLRLLLERYQEGILRGNVLCLECALDRNNPDFPF